MRTRISQQLPDRGLLYGGARGCQVGRRSMPPLVEINPWRCSCGLLAVSTNVGGVPEILPSDMLLLAEPNAQGQALLW